MPLFVICEILGVPSGDRQGLYQLTERMFGSDIADPVLAFEDGMAAAQAMRAYAAGFLASKRARLAEDITSDLIAAECTGRRPTEGDLGAFCMLLFHAGSDPTRSLLSHGLDLLLDRPADLRRLRDDPSLMDPAIEEMLRFESPVILFRRTATRDVELAG